MAWVYNHSRRSLLMMVLMHSALNSSQAVLGSVYADTLGTNPLAALVTVYEVAAVAFALVALPVVVGTRGRLGFSPSHASLAEATQR